MESEWLPYYVVILSNLRRASGFIENSSVPNDLQAWCYQCEAVFEEEDGMTERFREFNQMSVVCVNCYEQAAQYHNVD